MVLSLKDLFFWLVHDQKQQHSEVRKLTPDSEQADVREQLRMIDELRTERERLRLQQLLDRTRIF